MASRKRKKKEIVIFEDVREKKKEKNFF